MEKTAVVVRDLRKEFTLSREQRKKERTRDRKRVAVNNISFHADYGEIFCLLGADGAGKTTTLMMIANLMKPNGGEIVYDNDKRKSKRALKGKITFLTTQLNLDKSFSAERLFEYYGKKNGLTKEEISKRKEYLFSELGIEASANRKISELSKRMQQKVAIAVSLVNDPGIIVFDEPTSGLDFVTRAEIIEFLKKQREHGKCIILSTDMFDEAKTLADRVALMSSGNIMCIEKR